MLKARRVVVWAVLAVIIAVGAAAVLQKESVVTPAWAADHCKENCK